MPQGDCEATMRIQWEGGQPPTTHYATVRVAVAPDDDWATIVTKTYLAIGDVINLTGSPKLVEAVDAGITNMFIDDMVCP